MSLPLFVESATQISNNTIRLTFSRAPLQVRPANFNDALNINNYTIIGPGNNKLLVASPVNSDLQSIDLAMTNILASGTWSVNVINIQTYDNVGLTNPTTISLIVLPFTNIPILSNGTSNNDIFTILRKYLSPALVGTAWNALLAAIAVGDTYVQSQSELAYDQLFLSTASGIYLDRQIDALGLERPFPIGMSDDTIRELAIKVSANKITIESVLEVLETFYGSDATRAFSQSNTAPFALQNNSLLFIKVDEATTYTIVFHTADFSNISTATSTEVALAITRTLKTFGSNAYAISFVDPLTNLNYVRIYSGSLGLGSAIRITGGSAQNILLFPTKLATTQNIGTQWQIIPSTSSNSIIAGRTRYSFIGGPDPSLILVNIGDYVNIFGSIFNSINQGALPIVAVTPTYFEVSNPNGFGQTVTQVNINDIVFFTPTKETIQTGGRIATAAHANPNELDILLPATALGIINRGPNHAAYLHENTPVNITAASRDNTGLVTITAPGHGYQNGDFAIIDNVYPQNALSLSGPLGFVLDSSNTSSAISNNTAGAQLQDGRILVTGGDSEVTTTWIYDPISGLSNGPNMNVARAQHTATVLNNGRVLVTGGDGGATAEIYDPVSNTWTNTTSMNQSRTRHLAVLLNNGQVLVMGGGSATAEIYDPITTIWTIINPPSTDRQLGSALLLADGRALFTGGYSTYPIALNTAEVFDPFSNTWTNTYNMNAARFSHKIILLNQEDTGTSGNILVTGGTTDDVVSLNSCELFNPDTLSFSVAPSMANTRKSHTISKLPDNNVLVTGGAFIPTINAPIGSIAFIDAFDASIKYLYINNDAMVISNVPSGSVTIPYNYVTFTDVMTLNPWYVYVNNGVLTISAVAPIGASHITVNSFTMTDLFLGDLEYLYVSGGALTISNISPTVSGFNYIHFIDTITAADQYLYINGDALQLSNVAPGGIGTVAYNFVNFTDLFTLAPEYMYISNGILTISGISPGGASSANVSDIILTDILDLDTEYLYIYNGTLNVSDTSPISISVDTSSAEVFDPIHSQWSPAINNMNVGRSQHHAFLLNNKIAIVGGANANASGHPVTENYVTPVITVSAGGFNGLWPITVINNNTFTYQTPDFPFISTAIANNGTAILQRQTSNNIQGPFIYDPDNGLAITDIETTLNQTINAGASIKLLNVIDTTPFPDSGFLVIGFGLDQSTAPIPYLEKVSSTQLLIDSSFNFPSTLTSGLKVTFLTQRGAFVPLTPETVGTFYVTAASAGRFAAQQVLGQIITSGVNVNEIIGYPSDKGLGGEGLPASNATKLSDEVIVWGSDDLDSELVILRGTV